MDHQQIARRSPPPPYSSSFDSSSEARTSLGSRAAIVATVEDNSTPRFLTRSLDPDWIDIEMMGYWLQKCALEHGEYCRRPFGFDPSSLGRASLLIDVQKKCLVAAKPEHRYACLSYVWGGASTLKTGGDNLISLMETNSLDDRRNEIPRTIRDAIGLVHQLGIPYLWVDALCIIQDDIKSKHDQIQAMAGIYANAFVTIIAGNGWDANHGLRGIQGVTEPRHLSTFLKNDVRENLQPYDSIWYSRGWTFQEMIFSPRKIMFQYQLAVWECNKATWNESSLSKLQAPLKVPLDLVSVSPWRSRIEISAWPDIKQYVSLVADYATRKLTYSDDAVYAITSLLSVMSTSFVGGFISGLPEMFFNEALLWQPAESMQRRQAGGRSNTSLPSWSWVGWEGRIMASEWVRYWSHLYLPQIVGFGSTSGPLLQVSPLVAWFYNTESRKRYPINTSGQTYIDFITNSSLQLPPEWSSTKERTYIFRGQTSTESKYPIPTARDQTPCLKLARYLFCCTRRGYFKIRVYQQDWGQILDSDGGWVGNLNLNLCLPTKANGETFMVALVAISKGSAMARVDVRRAVPPLDDVDLDPKDMRDLRLRRLEAYHVLWVEWQEGIAYRRGLGFILKEDWDKQATEEIDLILG